MFCIGEMRFFFTAEGAEGAEEEREEREEKST
jgi:hypothetical protein